MMEVTVDVQGFDKEILTFLEEHEKKEPAYFRQIADWVVKRNKKDYKGTTRSLEMRVARRLMRLRKEGHVFGEIRREPQGFGQGNSRPWVYAITNRGRDKLHGNKIPKPPTRKQIQAFMRQAMKKAGMHGGLRFEVEFRGINDDGKNKSLILHPSDNIDGDLCSWNNALKEAQPGDVFTVHVSQQTGVGGEWQEFDRVQIQIPDLV